jgi:hypothetical protein
MGWHALKAGGFTTKASNGMNTQRHSPRPSFVPQSGRATRPAWTGGVAVRELIFNKSFMEQFDFGINTTRQFGGAE